MGYSLIFILWGLFLAAWAYGPELVGKALDRAAAAWQDHRNVNKTEEV